MPRPIHRLDVPLIRQPGGHECGVAALAAVLQFHGKHHAFDELARLAGTTEAGTDHANMIEAAIATGATVLAKAGGSIDELVRFVSIGRPVIVGWWAMAPGDRDWDPAWTLAERRERDCGHYSVIHGTLPGELVLMDPEAGTCSQSDAAFDRVWYDTDTATYDRVDRWFMVIDYERSS